MPRPSECPACGHEKPRRQVPVARLYVPAGKQAEETWTCGLCGYVWSMRGREVLLPRSPVR